MPFIENISLADVRDGYHYDAGPTGVLIQIVDPDMDFPTPKFAFSEVHRFRFLDLEEAGPLAIQADQAEAIVRVLEAALARGSNVIVHCHAGVCRSGAVTEVGCMMGFEDTGRYRAPNLLVKSTLIASKQKSGPWSAFCVQSNVP